MSNSLPRNSSTTSPVVRDPVCGMDVDPTTSPHSSERDGQTYYFCSGRCQAKFETSPGTYLSPTPSAEHDHGDHHHRPSRAITGAAPRGARRGHRVDLPDASGDPAAGTGRRARSAGWRSNRSR